MGYDPVQISIIQRRMGEEELVAGKFLVLWKLELGRASPDMV